MAQDPKNTSGPNSADEEWLQELYDLEASHDITVFPREWFETGNSKLNLKMIERRAKWQFSKWFPLEDKQIDDSDWVDYPGVYDIGVPVPISRLNGESKIIYIGRAAAQKNGDRGTIRGALRRHVRNGCPSEKWFRLSSPGQQLMARFAKADDVCQARYWEKLRIRWIIEQHWELPAGNTDRFRPGTPISTRELAKECAKWRKWAYSIA